MTYRRIKSLKPQGFKDIIDEYQIYNSELKLYSTLYICPCHKRNSKKAPWGFEFIDPNPPVVVPELNMAAIDAKIKNQEKELQKKAERDEIKWGCLPWTLIIGGGAMCMTPLLPLGIVVICIGAGMGGFGIAKGK